MARWRRDAVSAQDLADGGGGRPVPEPTQLALDPDHAPPGVLPGQAHDQRDELVRHRRTARRPGLAPFGRYQPPMPAQQRARSHDPRGAQRFRHDPRQRGEHGPIGPGHPRSGVRPAQHGHFVPQREYLHILSRRGPGQQRQPGQHGHQQPVSQRDKHGCRSCRHQNPRSSPAAEYSTTTGLQRDKVTHDGTEKKGPASGESAASGLFSQGVAGVGFEPT
jgi:hypothetical protein